ncbi:MAG: PBP1A family penicillin-binding protein [Actinobacteria bacterium]|nr:PBP1A family penicillin-binding protein [Actinomycetota bacterium]
MKKGINLKRKFVSWLPVALIFSALVVLLSISACSKIPRIEDLQPRQSALTSRVYASNGELIATFHAEENRILIDSSEIPRYLKDAIVATEDKSFYEHPGVSIRAIIRALVADILHRQIVQGGSTITQQYVKNVYLTSEKTLTRKFNEAVVAYQLEKNFSKDKILEMYLNTIYFGQGAYGVQVAAQTYFGIDAKDLNLAQCALLAALPKSPNEYNPFVDMQKARERRDFVLGEMLKENYITQTEYENATNTPIRVSAKPSDQDFGKAPYFVEYIKQQLIERYGTEEVFKGGMQIYTTLDIDMQNAAEKAISEVLFDPSDPSAALVAIDPSNGYIRAMVGGRDFAQNKFNLASQGKRQPGSAFKPFVLVTAIESGFPPTKTYSANGPITIDLGSQQWKVDNYGGEKFEEKLNLIDATKKSVNVVYAQLIMDVMPQKVVDVAKRMGIVSELENNPSIALGGLTYGVTPLEMASAYATLASQGVYHEPIAILKVTDQQGNIINEFTPISRPALDDTTSYLVTQILQKVILEGTGKNADIGRPAAGKTGTTQNHQDAWFIGYTPELAAAVWMGYPEANIPMERLRDRAVVGGTYPAEIWKKFMMEALKNIEPKDFPNPSKQLVEVEICSESGQLFGPFCPEENRTKAIFIEGKEPKVFCELHDSIQMPDLIGTDRDEAERILNDLKINYIVDRDYDDTQDEGEVFKQDPEPGSELKAIDGQAPLVTIYVSKGPNPISTLPSVIGLTEGEALSLLNSMGYNNISTEYQFNPSVDKGRVFLQSPQANSQVDKSSTIYIVISKGASVQVPNVVGMNITDATGQLTYAGIATVNVTYQNSNDFAKNTVISQDIAPETVLEPPVTINLVVSKGKAIVTPDLIGKTEQDAIAALTSAGLAYEVIREIDPTMPPENQTVYWQDPPAGALLSEGDIVKFKVNSSP